MLTGQYSTGKSSSAECAYSIAAIAGASSCVVDYEPLIAVRVLSGTCRESESETIRDSKIAFLSFRT